MILKPTGKIAWRKCQHSEAVTYRYGEPYAVFQEYLAENGEIHWMLVPFEE